MSMSASIPSREVRREESSGQGGDSSGRKGKAMIWNIFVFVVFTILWAGFAAALLVDRAALDRIWQQTRALPLPVQGLVWLLFLPVMIGLVVWETTWPLLVRLALVGGLGAWNVFIFYPFKS
jgi:hypothetical protein